jgi:membrane associated rhomboid family serine protease
MLWWFGRPLEALLGRGRFLAVYFLSILAGSAGALLLSPTNSTIGASGAVFGILGAGLVLERNRIDVFGGSALFVVIFNLAFSFAVSYISIGSHIGGLVGGALTVLVLSRFGKGHAVYGRFDLASAAGLVAIGVVSVAIAYFRARGYV